MSLFQDWTSGKTVRKHTMASIHRENIAEHTWGVAFLAIRYVPRLCTQRFLTRLILHDAGEKAAADIPSNICSELPEMKAACQRKEDSHVREIVGEEAAKMMDEWGQNPYETRLLHIFDRADFVLSCLYEYMLGNRLVCVERRRAEETLMELVRTFPRGGEMYRMGEEAGRRLVRDIHLAMDEEGVDHGTL